MEFTQAVYEVVREIPTGQVLSYGGVAALLGRPRSARAVGSALRSLPSNSGVPWWRVVNHAGRITTPRLHQIATVQLQLLREENVPFSSPERVDMARASWAPAAPKIEALRCRLGSEEDRIQALPRIE